MNGLEDENLKGRKSFLHKSSDTSDSSSESNSSKRSDRSKKSANKYKLKILMNNKIICNYKLCTILFISKYFGSIYMSPRH